MSSGSWTPEELSSIEFYLISMGPAHMIHTAGGHSLLRVQTVGEVIPAYKRFDRVYNWGTFDPGDPEFIPKFLKGVMPYSLDIGDALPYLYSEAHHNPREMIQHKIALTLRQKQRLMTRLHWWENPENTFYDYHIWLQNCATKVRDILDEATGHHIESYFKTKSTPETYRDLWMTTFGSWKFAATTADMMMNQVPDTTTDAWTQMFIPMRMMSSLETMPAWNDDGSPNETQRFLSERQVFHTGKVNYDVNSNSGYPTIAGFGLCVLALGLILNKMNLPRVYGWFLCCLNILWGAVAGVLGSAMLFMSLWSQREYFYFPSTMLLFWPLDFWWVWVGIQDLLWKKKPYLGKISYALSMAHLLSGAWYLLGHYLGFVPEDITRVALYVVPFYLIFYGLNAV